MDTGNPWAQTLGRLTHNYGVDLKQGIYIHGGTTADLPDTMEHAESVTLDPDAAFVDPSVLDFRFKKSFEPMDGFAPIPFAEIGWVQDEYRATVPDKRAYRKAVRDRYQGTPSSGGRYDPDTINERYPVPAYH